MNASPSSSLGASRHAAPAAEPLRRHVASLLGACKPGIAGATLQCPYHRWTYDLDGRVVGCGATGEAPAAQRRLKPVHVKTLAGLVFVCLADEPPDDFDDMAQRMTPYLAPHGLEDRKSVV